MEGRVHTNAFKYCVLVLWKDTAEVVDNKFLDYNTDSDSCGFGISSHYTDWEEELEGAKGSFNKLILIIVPLGLRDRFPIMRIYYVSSMLSHCESTLCIWSH